MNIERTKKAIRIMQAFVNGREIEYKCRNNFDEGEWKNTPSPCWKWGSIDYRIKPEPHYRPFKNAEEVMEAIKEHGNWVASKTLCVYILITEINHEGIIDAENNRSSHKEALDNYLFADGTPFGKLEEE